VRRHGLDQSISAGSRFERLAKGGDVHSQTHLLHECVRPDLAHEFILADQVTAAVGKSDKQIEGLASERDGLSAA
jgi:hypothetical protein